jgi:hypothetical protein
MHDHLFYVARPGDDVDHQSQLPLLLPQMTYSAPRLYLASGVTTLRTTGSLDPYTDLNLQAAIEANQQPGPHMDVTGPYLQGAANPFLQMHTLKGPEDARDTVNFWAAQGATSFKAYPDYPRGTEGRDPGGAFQGPESDRASRNTLYFTRAPCGTQVNDSQSRASISPLSVRKYAAE